MKITGYVATNRVGSRVTFEIHADESWFDDMEQVEREEYIEALAREAMFQNIEWSYEVEE